MQRRAENAVAWILSEPDAQVRKSELSHIDHYQSTYADAVSFYYRGERDLLCMTAADILGLLGRKFPRGATSTIGERPSLPIYIDIIESNQYFDARMEKVRSLGNNGTFLNSSHVTSLGLNDSEITTLGWNARALYSAEAFWVLLHESLIASCIEIVREAFEDKGFQQAPQLHRLDDAQKLLLVDASTRLAIEAAIHHEMGHIRHGHVTPGNNSFDEFRTHNSLVAEPNESAWNMAKEMAADDFAAQSLTMRALNNVFWSFPVDQKLLDTGEFAVINALLIGVFAYFAAMEIHAAKTNPDNANAYPDVDMRVRYFYMAFVDTYKENRVTSFDIGPTLFSKLGVVLKAYHSYFNALYRKDAAKYRTFNNLFTWVPGYGSYAQYSYKDDAEWMRAHANVTQQDLAEELRVADDAEAKVMARVDRAYKSFKIYEPAWEDFSYFGEAN